MKPDIVVDTTPGKLTPYLRLDEILIEYAHTLQDVLISNFVGMYLSGSLAIGDFDLTSDVDFSVVINDELSDGEVEKVQTSHAALVARDSRWVKHLEYSFFPMDRLLTPSSPFGATSRNDLDDRRLWYFENGGSTVEQSDHCNTLVTRWTLREKSTAVLGPEPASFMRVVTPDELRTEIKNSILGWSREVFADWAPYYNRFFQAFFVLNYCRVLQDLHEGRITSKLDGVKWAKTHLDPKWYSLIDYCWLERQDTTIHVSQPAQPEVFKQTIAFSEYATRLGEAYQLPSE
ncbi:MAG: aminoglycoside adenylyltransferase domain-containing protein [Acidobacteriota bacterium]